MVQQLGQKKETVLPILAKLRAVKTHLQMLALIWEQMQKDRQREWKKENEVDKRMERERKFSDGRRKERKGKKRNLRNALRSCSRRLLKMQI